MSEYNRALSNLLKNTATLIHLGDYKLAAKALKLYEAKVKCEDNQKIKK